MCVHIWLLFYFQLAFVFEILFVQGGGHILKTYDTGCAWLYMSSC